MYRGQGHRPIQKRPTESPRGGSGECKPCDHKYIYLDKRRVLLQDSTLTDFKDVFYCEKCLSYEYR
jgi:hypothetical protein